MMFHNLKGITSKHDLDEMKDRPSGLEGIEHKNLATFLSNFDFGVLYSNTDNHDYIAFRLRKSKTNFELERLIH